MDCLFCKIAQIKDQYIAETESLFAIWDKYPVSKGHAMVIPKRHIVGMYELNKKEASEIPEILNKIKEKIEEKAKKELGKLPKGYNIGSNDGEAAGQVIMHLHIHVIPRYKGEGRGIQALGDGEPR